MIAGIVGFKRGMTRIFADDGSAVAVTVIEALPNRVVQRKTKKNDGYNSVQVTYGHRKPSRCSKAEREHFSKARIQPGLGLSEIPFDDSILNPGQDEAELTVGSEISVASFSEVHKVDVTSVSKGKGFAGTIKRWNFKSQDATHGNSLAHRAAGSIGQCQTPGKVWKGKKMAGHMGNKKVTRQSLVLEKCIVDDNLLLVRGSVPGSVGSKVFVRRAIKAPQSVASS